VVKAFVIFRDRVTYARRCTLQLLESGLDVHVVDHGSTYPEALQWLNHLRSMNVPVWSRPNGHARTLWDWDRFPEIVGERDRYVVTDCDVVPDAPDDWLAHLGSVLDRHPEAAKVGLGLRIDDLPTRYLLHSVVCDWERRYWVDRAEPGVWRADVDTTLALYRPLGEVREFTYERSLRTDHPYVARHLTWYEDSGNLPDEINFYRKHLGDDHHTGASMVHWSAS
jgi:hypothetical protein